MVALRKRSKRRGLASLGLWTLAFVLLPATVGQQDLAAQGVLALAASGSRAVEPSFGFLHFATLGSLQPLGAAMAKPLDPILVRLAPSDIVGVGPLSAGRIDSAPDAAAATFPEVDRSHKADALLLPATHERTEAADAAPANPITGLSDDDGVWPDLGSLDLAVSLNPAMDTARLYFGPGIMDAPLSELERGPVEAEGATDAKPSSGHGETVAGKGEVTGPGKHPRSPAERLGLKGKARAKAERCLANAVYFESRGEPVRGQIAVAQVVMNRVFSEFYPDDVCGVVYQNANRHLACQFTFACDGIPDVVTEPAAWRRAKLIAKDMLDGKLWVAEVGKATHYHAYWVHPNWVHEMKKLYKLGVHTFYRPRAWGDGSDEPTWGNPKKTAALVKTL